MKKILALVLAVMMMATVALAAHFTPGATIAYDDASFAKSDGTTIAAGDKELTSKNFSIKKVSWDKGKDLVESVKINDDDEVVEIVLKQDYTMDEEKTLEGTITLRVKGGSTEYTASVNSKTIAYNAGTITLTDKEDNLGLPAADTVYTVKDGSGNGTSPYGTLTFETVDGYEVSVRVYEDEVYFLESNADANKEILLANADVDADYIDFVNFVAAPTFNSNATISFYGVEEDDHIYAIKNGKLVASGAKWDEDAGTWTLKTRTLGSYVISDAKLVTSSASVDNPDTGANDVVGIATALAAVALVSAAAVSLKK